MFEQYKRTDYVDPDYGPFYEVLDKNKGKVVARFYTGTTIKEEVEAQTRAERFVDQENRICDLMPEPDP